MNTCSIAKIVPYFVFGTSLAINGEKNNNHFKMYPIYPVCFEPTTFCLENHEFDSFYILSEILSR